MSWAERTTINPLSHEAGHGSRTDVVVEGLRQQIGRTLRSKQDRHAPNFAHAPVCVSEERGELLRLFAHFPPIARLLTAAPE